MKRPALHGLLMGVCWFLVLPAELSTMVVTAAYAQETTTDKPAIKSGYIPSLSFDAPPATELCSHFNCLTDN